MDMLGLSFLMCTLLSILYLSIVGQVGLGRELSIVGTVVLGRELSIVGPVGLGSELSSGFR